MLEILETSGDNVLGVEIVGGYTKADFEAAKQAFDEKAAQAGGKLNILVKIDQLKISETEVKAVWDDMSYALSNLDKLGHIAVVGHSTIEKYMVGLDNLMFGSKKAGREEKYFDAADLDQAWAFVKA